MQKKNNIDIYCLPPLLPQIFQTPFFFLFFFFFVMKIRPTGQLQRKTCRPKLNFYWEIWGSFQAHPPFLHGWKFWWPLFVSTSPPSQMFGTLFEKKSCLWWKYADSIVTCARRHLLHIWSCFIYLLSLNHILTTSWKVAIIFLNLPLLAWNGIRIFGLLWQHPGWLPCCLQARVSSITDSE